MKKKPILLYVNPNNSSEIKEFNLSFKKITFVVVLFLAVLVFVLKYSVDFIVEFNQNSKINQLKKENMVLQAELEKIGNKISTIRSN